MAILFMDKFDRLTREKLLAMVREYLPIVQNEQRLRNRVAVLSMEIDRLKKEVARRAQLSRETVDSQSGADRSSNQNPARRTQAIGERRKTNPLIDNPYQTVNAGIGNCRTCKKSLRNLPPEKIVRRQLMELPEVKPRLIVTRQYELCCPNCQSANHGELPVGLEGERSYGPRVESKVVYLKQQLGLSNEWVVDVMQQMFGIELSDQCVISILEQHDRRAAAAQKEEKEGEVVYAFVEDGTVAKARRLGQRVLNHVKDISSTLTTSQRNMLEGGAPRTSSATILVRDPIPSLLKEPPKFAQLCLQTQLRELQGILDQHPDEIWAEAIKRLFLEAIELREGIYSSQKPVSQQGYVTRVMELEKMLDVLLTHNLLVEESRKLRDRFVRHRDKLLAFLHHPDLSPRNPMAAA